MVALGRRGGGGGGQDPLHQVRDHDKDIVKDSDSGKYKDKESQKEKKGTKKTTKAKPNTKTKRDTKAKEETKTMTMTRGCCAPGLQLATLSLLTVGLSFQAVSMSLIFHLSVCMSVTLLLVCI